MDFSVFKPQQNTAGPLAKFVLEDVLRAFWLVGRKQPIGRKDLADSLDLGEGTARTIETFLEKRGLARKIRGGCVLSDNGRRAFEKLSSKVLAARQLPPLFSTLERPSYCLQCAIEIEPSVSDSIKARDAAVKAGSEGLLALLYKNKKLLFWGTRDSISSRDSKLISSAFSPAEGNVFVLSFARKPLDRERGAWAAFLALASPA